LTLFRPNIQNFIQNTPTSSRKTPIFSFFFISNPEIHHFNLKITILN
jgi:hypothetical protein